MNTPSYKYLLLGTLATNAFVFIIKVALAFRLELYSDEIFYWQASQFPALAYSDLPFMAALFAGIGSELLGNSPAAVRSLFMLCGLMLPLLIFWVAHPLQGRKRALISALLCLCLPMLALMGLLAVPDAALLVFGLLFIGFLERATRLGDTSFWIAAGVAAALGLCTHYRFAPYILAALVFFLFDKRQWRYWKMPRLWISASIASAGLFPALSFNFINGLAGLDYHLVERHPWQFQPEGLLHPLIQATVVTPLLYATLLLTLWRLVQQARQGNDRALLFSLFALANLGIYLVLAPWSDTTRTTLHWPISGYLPLLVFAPATLKSLQESLSQKWPRHLAFRLTLLVPVSGMVGTLLLFAGIGSQGFNQSLQHLVGPGVLSNKMAGWSPLVEHLESLRAQHGLSEEVLVVTDNYYTAAQVSFATGNDRVFTTDTNKVIRDGRQTQYRIWGLDTPGLQEYWSEDAIFITEDSTLDSIEKSSIMAGTCSLFSEVGLLDQLFLFQGDKVFSFYRATGLRPAGMERKAFPECPMPSESWLDTPGHNAEIRDQTVVSGWAINSSGITTIRVLLDGELVAETNRTLAREDVIRLKNADFDPAAPLVGFAVEVDTRRFKNGQYQLSLELLTGAGERQRTGSRAIRINNE
ncbi:glycosyltransferase family 39 protein [Gammaproteobacteria bacterium LSUCC0112]|nr:glycosyltransferase family 39 protein [Gammaproteobacteria bacterium LSUCC0112]